MTKKIIKPNKQVFIAYKVLILSLIFAIPLIVFSILLPNLFVIFFVIYFLIIGLNFYLSKIQFDKRIYIIEEQKIIIKGGGIFNDYKTELLYKNITFVKRQLPFITNKFFKTGNLLINSAGGIGTEINFSSIDNLEEIYNLIILKMQENGFSLKSKNLIQQKSPNFLAVLFESLNFVFLTFIGLAFFYAYLILEFVGKYPILNFILLICIFGFVFVNFVFYFLDLKKRFYCIYEDFFYYKEGFLTKNYIIMPIENLSDSSISQNFLSKILGLYDIKISCQGTGQEINFKNINQGNEFVNNIKKALEKFQKLHYLNNLKKENSLEKTQNLQTSQTFENNLNKLNTFNFMKSYKMHFLRVIFIPLFCLILIGILGILSFYFFPEVLKEGDFFLSLMFYFVIIFATIFLVPILKALFTKYEVREKSFYQSYNFLNKKTSEFNLDKITGIIFKENIIDKFFNTCSIKFWSIGSEKSLIFSNIKKDENLYENILKKVKIDMNQKSYYNLKSNFNFSDLFKKFFWLFSIYFLIIIFCFVFGFLNNFIFYLIGFFLLLYFIINYLYYKKIYNFENLEFCKNHTYFRTGFLTKSYYYVNYKNIKDIETQKYPFSKTGNIKFNIAGEETVKQGNQHVKKSCEFITRYIKNIEILDEIIDLILKNGIENINDYKNYTPQIILKTKPDVKSDTFSIFIICLISIILIPFSLFICLYVYFSSKKTNYFIENFRIVIKSGILYKKQKSIIFEKIDFININSGIFDKIFKNSSIIINTTGSSEPELKLTSIKNYKMFYEQILKHYNKYENK